MDTNITPKPRARIVRMPTIPKPYWIVTCGKYEGFGATIPQAYFDWQVQSTFKLFA